MNMLRHYFILLAIVLAPLASYSGEPDEPIKQVQAHKPPILTTTAIIEIYEAGLFKGIVLIERGKAPFGMAIPGGKVEYGETVENAIRREMKEEVNLDLNDLRQFHVYSDPKRDFRHHSVEVAHIAKAYKNPKAGDDAAKAFIVKLEDIPWSELAFDHALVLRDYLEWKNGDASRSMPKIDP
jgi:8-oxo-dGTP diphosphatase